MIVGREVEGGGREGQTDRERGRGLDRRERKCGGVGGGHREGREGGGTERREGRTRVGKRTEWGERGSESEG